MAEPRYKADLDFCIAKQTWISALQEVPDFLISSRTVYRNVLTIRVDHVLHKVEPV